MWRSSNGPSFEGCIEPGHDDTRTGVEIERSKSLSIGGKVEATMERFSQRNLKFKEFSLRANDPSDTGRELRAACRTGWVLAASGKAWVFPERQWHCSRAGKISDETEDIEDDVSRVGDLLVTELATERLVGVV